MTIQNILQQYQDFFETAIHDGHARGDLIAPNAACKARCLFHFYEGALAQARLHNDVSLLKDLYENALDLMGARPALAA